MGASHMSGPFFVAGQEIVNENGEIVADITAPPESIGTSELEDGAVTLVKLDSGVTPSHLVKFAGKATWSGGGATLAETVTGVAATDIVVATIQTKPTESAYLVGAVPSTDTVTFELSAANTSNDAVIAYTVLNAAA